MGSQGFMPFAGVGAGADLLSHECTFGADMGEKARIAQHSTAPMAGAFARALGAKALVLTHFSGRFMDFRGRVGIAVVPDQALLCRVAAPKDGSLWRLWCCEWWVCWLAVWACPNMARDPTKNPESESAKQPQILASACC